MAWRVVITVTRSWDQQQDALDNLNGLVSKVPDGWEIRTQDLKHE